MNWSQRSCSGIVAVIKTISTGNMPVQSAVKFLKNAWGKNKLLYRYSKIFTGIHRLNSHFSNQPSVTFRNNYAKEFNIQPYKVSKSFSRILATYIEKPFCRTNPRGPYLRVPVSSWWFLASLTISDSPQISYSIQILLVLPP